MSSRKIVFIDSGVPSYQTLVKKLTGWEELFVLDAESNGLTQMAAHLQGRTDIDAIHVISHGSQGALYLGSTVLDSANLATYGVQLADIGRSLAPAGDILLYGCNVAQGDVGIQFIASLAQYTGADVAASNNLTGGSLRLGDLEFERTAGIIESVSILPESYEYLLAPETLAANVELLTYSWKAHTLLSGVSLSATGTTHSGTTDINGAASFT